MTAVWVYIFSHIKTAFVEKLSIWRLARCPESFLEHNFGPQILDIRIFTPVETIHREIMSNPDTACHARSPGIFTKVAIKAFYLKVGRKTKLLFEQLKKKYSIEKETHERCRTGKEHCSAFTRIRQLLVLLLSSSTFPVLWHEEKGKKWPRGKKRPFKNKNFVRKVNRKRIPCPPWHTLK